MDYTRGPLLWTPFMWTTHEAPDIAEHQPRVMEFSRSELRQSLLESSTSSHWFTPHLYG